MKIGSAKIGTPVPVEGRIRNLNVYGAGPGGLEATYVHEGAIAGQHQAITYVNGTFTAVDTDQVSGASGLNEGSQNIIIVPMLQNQRIPAIRFDDIYGGRVLLDWVPVTGDIEGYYVYTYDPDTVTYTLLSTVTDREFPSTQLMQPTTGTGSGRISAPATPLPDTVNDTFIMTITGAGTADWAVAGESGSLEFARGSIIPLVYNIQIAFEDDTDAYVTGDTYEIPAGIVTSYTTDDLVPGVYQYAISAFGKGSESDKVLSQEYEIQSLPDPVTPTETWNDATKTLTIDTTTPSGAAGVRLYHNFLPQEQTFTDYVSEVAASTNVIPFGAATGTLLYYVRPYTAAGLELPDFTLHSVEIPVLSGALSVPANVTVEAVGIQQWSAAWTYDVNESDALASFTIHRQPHGTPFDYTTDIAGTMTLTEALPGSGYTVDYDFTMTGDTTPAGELDIQIVAHGSGGEIRYSDTVTVTTNAAAVIAAPSALKGGAV